MGSSVQSLIRSKFNGIEVSQNKECNWDYFVNRESFMDIYSISSSQDGKSIILHRENTITMYDAKTGLQIRQTIHGEFRPYQQIICSHYESYIVAEGGNDGVRIWDPKSKKLIRHSLTREVTISQSPQTNIFASSYYTHQCKIWTVNSGYRLLKQIECVSAADFCSNNKQVIIVHVYNNKISINNIYNEKQIHYHRRQEQVCYSVTYQPIGNIAAYGSDNAIKILNLRTNKLIATLKKIKSDVMILQFSPKGHTLISAQREKLLQWNIAQRSSIQLKSKKYPITSLGFSSDGKYIATLDTDRNLLFQLTFKQD